MAGVSLDFDIADIAKVSGTLAQLPSDFNNTDQLLNDVAAYLQSDTLERFTREEAPDGTKWTQSQRAADDGGLTLTDKRNLADSWSSDISGDGLEFGSDEVYAAIHHYGGETGVNGSVTIEERTLIGLAEPQIISIAQIVSDWGNDAIN